MRRRENRELVGDPGKPRLIDVADRRDTELVGMRRIAVGDVRAADAASDDCDVPDFWHAPSAPLLSSAAHPRPVVAMPSISRRWKNRKNTKTGSRVSTDMANSAPQSDLPVGIHEGAQAQSARCSCHVVQVDQRAEEVVPGPDEGEDRGGRQRRQSTAAA